MSPLFVNGHLMRLTQPMVRRFRSTVLSYFEKHGRFFPWRLTTEPYEILVSEVMLQQTQTDRVSGYYFRFLEKFPDIEALANAPLREVLRVWQGLGYNRRALFLKRCAEEVASHNGGDLPNTVEGLLALPGVGPYTARAVLTFAFNQPHVFIETNIRAVYLHHFFLHRDKVNDREILPLVEETLDREDPRRWYYALMDYGSYLKSVFSNPSRRSAHHSRQTRFLGSLRQVRGSILRVLAKGACRLRDLRMAVANDLGDETFENSRFDRALSDLCEEGLVTKKAGRFSIPD